MNLLMLARVIVAAVVVSAAVAPGGAATLYASGNGTGPGGALSAIYEVDSQTGASTLVFEFPSIHIYNGGLAYDASSDTLYATGVEDSSTGTSRLFAIDRATGAVTALPGMSPSINISQGGLALHPLTGVLYATGGNGFQSSGLFTIDKITGAATLIGQTGGQCCVNPYGFNINGIGFRSDGTLFANGFTLTDGISSLFTLDLATGVATVIGAHGVSSSRALRYSGLAFRADGVLLSLGDIDGSNDGFFGIDPATGAATLLGGTGPQYGNDGGLTFAVPEPALLALLGAAFAGLIARRRATQRTARRRNNFASLGFAVASLLCLASPAQAASILYASGVGTGPNAPLSAIYEVDPFSGASTLVFGFPTIHIYEGGLAYDASSDTLYATGVEDSSTGSWRLFAIDRATGALTSFPAISSVVSFQGLALDPTTGVLYATGKGSPAGTQLYTIDKLTGAASLVGSTLNGFLIFYGLGFASDGTLFANGLDVRNPPDGRLFTVDLATGAETDVGPHGAAPAQLAYSGLAFRPDGTLLSLGSVTASTHGLYAVDPTTGAATLLGNTPGFGTSGGLTFAVPEPGALLLFGAAFVAGVARRALKTPRS